MIRFSPTMLAIHTEKQLFLDDLLVEAASEIKRTFHSPAKSGASPVIEKDKPWEREPYFSGGSHNAFRDPEDGLFKCLYNDYRLDREDWKRRGHICLENHMMTVNYACSEDGLTWRKPALGIMMEDGHNTNIVFGNGAVEQTCAYNFKPVFNPHETDSAKRLRTLYWGWSEERGMYQDVAYSPDAIHWTPSDVRPTFGNAPGIGDVLFSIYCPHTRQYVASVRHHYMSDVQFNPRNPVGTGFLAFEPHYPLDFTKMPKRMVWQIESGDFLHWTDPHLILAPEDGFDNIDDEFYGMAQYPVGDIRIGFLNVFHKTDNTMDVQLVYTRDGCNWNRLNKGQPFLTMGPEGSWDQCMVTIMSSPIQVGDELYIFHGGSKSHHDWWMSGPLEGLDAPEVHDLAHVGYGLGLARLRLDGFVSLDASTMRHGILVTRPFISDGEELVINAKVDEGGYIDVEVVDGADEPVPGCSRAECDTFTGDSVRQLVTWRGNKAIGKGTGGGRVQAHEYNQFRKLRFFMHRASLYSFQMTAPGQYEREMKYPGVRWKTDA